MNRDPEIAAIAKALKQILKAKKTTYKSLAERLNVSEQTIKRVLNGDDCSVSRLVEICSELGVKFFELMQLANSEQEHSFTLTEEQEQFFVDNPEYHAFFDAIRLEDLEEIRKKHKLSERSVFLYLKKLDEMGLCELYEGNRFKLKVSGSNSWRGLGPLSKTYTKKNTLEFVNHLFDRFDSGSMNDSLWTMTDTCVTKESYAELRAELREIAKRYSNRAERDKAFFPKEQLTNIMWMLAIAKDYTISPVLEKIPNL
jgi:transcriptional regulator with XRE-family HTH domain